MIPTWKEYNYISKQSYKDIEQYEIVKADFEKCTFHQVSFYWNEFHCVDLKECIFVNCTFAGVSFVDSTFVKCTFYNCEFVKSKKGNYPTSEDSYAIDCIIDESSSQNNPLSIQQAKDEVLLTPEIKQLLYSTFVERRPDLAVDKPGHCLSCEETQETHEKIIKLETLTVDHFSICYMSVEAFSEKALRYYMPKLLELLLSGEENKWDSYKRGFLSQLIPNQFGDRFQDYHQEQIKLIVVLLELFYNKYNKIEETWDYEKEMMTDASMYKDELEHCQQAIKFWRNKWNDNNE